MLGLTNENPGVVKLSLRQSWWRKLGHS